MEISKTIQGYEIYHKGKPIQRISIHNTYGMSSDITVIVEDPFNHEKDPSYPLYYYVDFSLETAQEFIDRLQKVMQEVQGIINALPDKSK